MLPLPRSIVSSEEKKTLQVNTEPDSVLSFARNVISFHSLDLSKSSSRSGDHGVD